MRLHPGTHLGAYEVLQLVGAGGMGEVYKARDTRLDRVVAVKILPQEFASDTRRRERFQREARAVAALNHPHICSLHDVGEAAHVEAVPRSGRIPFLVMEYLEGQTLAERLLRGPLPISDVLRYSTQLADALAHAHARGLVHRDLKPGNIMLTDEGTKLLDFGLSRIHAAPSVPALTTESAAAAPLTAEGAVLGTYPYMSPEQLGGRDADSRSDIFALGAIMHEMVTGERAFKGTTAAALIGQILHIDPPSIKSRQPSIPPAFDRMVRRCLAKNPDDRWQTARDLALELQTLPEPHSTLVTPRSRAVLMAAMAVAAIAIVIAAATVIATLRRPSVESSIVKLMFSPPDGLTMSELAVGGPVTISPDGKRVAFVAAGTDGKRLLWVRPLESLVAQPLPGTDGASFPFWSVDSQSVGFFAQRKLKKIALSGGPPQTLCDAVLPRGGTWNARGEIVFSAGAGRHLYRASVFGGPATPLPPDGINQERYWPSFLPDGRHYIYFGRPQRYGIFVAAIDSPETKLLLSDYVSGTYVPGFLVGLLGSSRGAPAGMLLAQAFDVSRLEVIGEPRPLAERIQYDSGYARAAFSVSDNGILVYGTVPNATTELRWFDRRGTALEGVGGSEPFGQPSLSPDEKTLAVERVDPVTQDEDIWLIDRQRNLPSRFTAHANNFSFFPVWSPSGDRVVFAWARGAPPNLYQKTRYRDREEILLKSISNTQPTDWSRDERFLVYASLDPNMEWDLWYLSMLGPQADRTPVLYLQTEFNEHLGRLSPDGRWLAYVSDESGRNDVYVRRFPDGSGKTRISENGGSEPRWNGDGTELFYLTPDDRLMAAPIVSGTAIRTGTPATLFTTRIGPPRSPAFDINYAVTGDGSRFLIRTLTDGSSRSPTTIVLNWTAGIGAR